jgi:phospholipase C
VAVPVCLLVIAAACSGTPTGAKKSTRKPSVSKSPASVKRTEGYGNQTFVLGPDRTPVTRPTAPPPPAKLPAHVPIDHIIFVVKENRTFDTYFGQYPGADGTRVGKTIEGKTVPLKPAPDTMKHDITHGFWSGLYSVDGGRMDGFDTIAGGQNLEGYVQMSRSKIPHYFDYADRFALDDHFFSSMYGPTYPEHLYTIAAQSHGIVDNKTENTEEPGHYCDSPNAYTIAFHQNLSVASRGRIMRLENEIVDDSPFAMEKIETYFTQVRDCFDIKILPDELQHAGISWKFYSDPWFPIGDIMRAIRHVRFGPEWKKVVPSETFLDDIKEGTLPQVSWVNPPIAYNEHPTQPHRDQSVCAGENWTVQMMNELQDSPYWKHTAVIETWDDFGGFYDHVTPPQYDIMGLGARVPGLVMSPYTAHGSNRLGGKVDHTTYEFSSVLRFIEEVFHLPALGQRDRQADPLSGSFDFSKPPDMHKFILPLRQDCPYGKHPPFLDNDNVLPG